MLWRNDHSYPQDNSNSIGNKLMFDTTPKQCLCTDWGYDKVLDRVDILQKYVSCVSIYLSILCQDVLSYKLMGWNAFQFVSELRSSFSYECDLNWLHKEYFATKYTTEKSFCLHNVALNRRHKDYFGIKYTIEFLFI